VNVRTANLHSTLTAFCLQLKSIHLGMTEPQRSVTVEQTAEVHVWIWANKFYKPTPTQDNWLCSFFAQERLSLNGRCTSPFAKYTAFSVVQKWSFFPFVVLSHWAILNQHSRTISPFSTWWMKSWPAPNEVSFNVPLHIASSTSILKHLLVPLIILKALCYSNFNNEKIPCLL